MACPGWTARLTRHQLPRHDHHCRALEPGLEAPPGCEAAPGEWHPQAYRSAGIAHCPARFATCVRYRREELMVS